MLALLGDWRSCDREHPYASARHKKRYRILRHAYSLAWSMSAEAINRMQAADAQQLSTLQSLDVVPAGFPTTQKVAPYTPLVKITQLPVLLYAG